jgi:hypothetical protein
VPVEPKDIVIAALGASAAIAGLILIFSGFLFAQAATFPATTADEVIKKFQWCGRLGTLPFLSCMAVTAVSFRWLLNPSPLGFDLSIYLFYITLALTTIYGTATILFLL